MVIIPILLQYVDLLLQIRFVQLGDHLGGGVNVPAAERLGSLWFSVDLSVLTLLSREGGVARAEGGGGSYDSSCRQFEVLCRK